MPPVPAANRKLTVFLCHGSEDKPAVVDLHKRLVADGYDPWLDSVNLLAGQRWAREIPRAVRASDVILVCLSVASASKEGYLQKEIRTVLDVADEKPDDTIFVIPVRLDVCEIPDRLREWHWVNYFDGAGAGYGQITRSLNHRAAELGLLAPAPIAPPDAPAASETPLLKINPADGAEMVYIPAGPFFMGDEDVASIRSDNPRHTVTLSGYYIYKNDVTVAMYRTFSNETGHPMPPAPNWGLNDDHPIVNLTWEDATAYCHWAGVSLPTEAQWEKAARGTDGRKYPWGDAWDASRCANSVAIRLSSTHSVGGYPSGASPYGVLDMAGNVWQWCSDWYDADYWKSVYGTDPAGPASGQYRVVRGGSWYDYDADYFRSAFRLRNAPSNRNYIVGFRAAAPGLP